MDSLSGNHLVDVTGQVQASAIMNMYISFLASSGWWSILDICIYMMLGDKLHKDQINAEAV